MEQNNFKFLVVDDHLMLRQMVTITLNRSGFKIIETANDGAVALEKIKAAADQSQPYDVVFLDWSMPNFDGYELLLSCRADPRLDQMAIIMLTSESEDQKIAKAMEAGATAYITKPFKPENIVKQLEYVVSWRSSIMQKKRPIKLSNTMHIPLDTRLADSLRTAIETTFQDSFQIDAQVSGWSLENGPLALDAYILCSIEMHDAQSNQPCGIFMMGFSQQTILKILDSYGIANNANEKILNDAAEEIVNMVFGMVKTSLGQRGYSLAMEFPSTDKSRLPLAARAVSAASKMIVPFATAGHECRLIIAQIL